jgi:hypothetical protein
MPAMIRTVTPIRAALLEVSCAVGGVFAGAWTSGMGFGLLIFND